MAVGGPVVQQLWTVKPEEEIAIKVADGADSPVTLIDCLKKTTTAFGGRPAMKVKRKGDWETMDYNQYYKDVRAAAKSMIKLGLERYHGVGIMGFNSPEWNISFMASIMAGGIGTGVYTTNSKDACQYIAENSRAQLFICENNIQVNKILQIKDNLPLLKSIVKYLPETEETLEPTMKEVGVLTWNEFMETGKDVSDGELENRIQSLKPGQCATLIYTSGTTGPPKGVMLSHDNLIFVCKGMNNSFHGAEDDCLVSFLPLSHIAGQIADIVNPAFCGLCVHFAQPDALKGTLKDTLVEVRPSAILSVPRLWEKFKEAIESQLGEVKGVKKFILDKSMDVGRRTQANRIQGQPKPEVFGYRLADRIVYKNLKEKLGLDRCKVCISGAAPLPKAVVDFYAGFDISILQLYGMSETSSTATFNTHEHYKPYSVGKPMEGVEVKIDTPDENTGEGEICFRGRNVFMGYLYNEEKTKEAMDEEGWLHSGDLGMVDVDGFLYITGRKKELIITKGGENIAPLAIEENMKEEISIISNIMVVGDDQRYLTMLLTLKCVLNEDLQATDKLSPAVLNVLTQQINSQATTVAEAIADKSVQQYIRQGMERANERAISKAARVQKFTILPIEFSIDGGELTSTMKLKRAIAAKKYTEAITSMYSE